MNYSRRDFLRKGFQGAAGLVGVDVLSQFYDFRTVVGEVSNLEETVLKFVDEQNPDSTQKIPVTSLDIISKKKEYNLILVGPPINQEVPNLGDTVSIDYLVVNEENIYKYIWNMFCPERNYKNFTLTSKRLEADGLVYSWWEVPASRGLSDDQIRNGIGYALIALALLGAKYIIKTTRNGQKTDNTINNQ